MDDIRFKLEVKLHIHGKTFEYEWESSLLDDPNKPDQPLMEWFMEHYHKAYVKARDAHLKTPGFTAPLLTGGKDF